MCRTVNHSILLAKLENYGIRWVIKWVGDGWKIEIDGHVPDNEVTLCGVPQGSVLAPLLFLLYVNDIFKSFKELSFHLFADHSTLTYTNKNLSVLESTVNREFAKVCEWLEANKLTLYIITK